MKKVTVKLVAANHSGQYGDPVLNALSALFNFTNIGRENKNKWVGTYKPSTGMMQFSGILFAANKAKELVRGFTPWKFSKGNLVSAGQTNEAGYLLVHYANGLKVIKDKGTRAEG